MFACCKAPQLDSENEVRLDVGGFDDNSSQQAALLQQPALPQKQALDDLLDEKPYLNLKHHVLHYFVKLAQEAISKNDEGQAQNALDALVMEADVEEKTIAAAFQRFDSSKDGVLVGEEIRFMLDYLGFPNEPKDVDALLEAVDSDHDHVVSADEFLNYVGRVGGSLKLFELRRQQIEARHRQGFARSVTDPQAMRIELQEAGFDQTAIAYWRLVAPQSELDSVARMEPCQKQAVRHIRALAQENHERALPSLQKRVAKLGFGDNDLWMALAWIRELAPIIVHINLDKVGQFFLNDTHYRNQFETGTSSGLLKTSAREKWEQGLFGPAYDGAKPFSRPKYGVQNIWNDYRGVLGAKQYGDSYVVLHNCRLRCTFAPEDSANLPARRLSVPDYYGHVLNEYSDKELAETIRVAAAGREHVGDSQAVIEKWGKYKEAQIHGEVNFAEHVERLVVNERHRNKEAWIKDITEKHGWKMTWMSDMKTELESRAGGREAGDEEWKTKLAKIKGDELAQEGFCRMGCGREAKAGCQECCEGCARGFGHDSSCAQARIFRQATIPTGKCKQGCGRDAAPGSDVCCSRCSKVAGVHTADCGGCNIKFATDVPAGLCKMACGRKVHPGATKSGKPYDTCCRQCALGKGHSASCGANNAPN